MPRIRPSLGKFASAINENMTPGKESKKYSWIFFLKNNSIIFFQLKKWKHLGKIKKCVKILKEKILWKIKKKKTKKNKKKKRPKKKQKIKIIKNQKTKDAIFIKLDN